MRSGIALPKSFLLQFSGACSRATPVARERNPTAPPKSSAPPRAAWLVTGGLFFLSHWRFAALQGTLIIEAT
jgi:hypothetical protein